MPEMKSKQIIIFMCLLGSISSGWSITVDFDITPKTLRVNEAATATFTIQGVRSPPPPNWPRIPGVTIYAPRKIHKSININGRAEEYTSYQYKIVPTKPGHFNIGPFSYSAGDKTIGVSAQSIKVVPAGGSANLSRGQPANPTQQISASLTTKRTTVYHQETFDIDLLVYTPTELQLNNQINILNLPNSGLSIPQKQLRDLGTKRDTINQKIYNVRRIRLQAKALTQGTFKLNPTVRVGLLLRDQSRRRRGFFDSFFSRTQVKPLDIRITTPLEINVLPLPQQDRPPHFSGAVGSFSFTADIKPDELQTGDPVTITMTIHGNGNIDAVSTPKINLGADFKSYDPKLLSSEINNTQTAGRKVFEQVVIPKSAAISDIPAIHFSYFNPSKKKYHTITKGPFPLTIRATGENGAKVVQGNSETIQRTARIIGTDIIYLKASPKRWHRGAPWLYAERKGFWFLQSLPALALIGIYIMVRRRDVLHADTAKARRHKAPKSARAGIQKAQEAIRTGNLSLFYESLDQILTEYFGHRLNLAPGEVSCQRVCRMLRGKGLDQVHLERLKSMFEQCDNYRFSRSTSSDQDGTEGLQAQLDDLNALLKTCEKIK